MFHILGFLIFIVVIILISGVAILSKVIKTFLGLGRKITGTDNRTTGSYSYGQQNRTQSERNNSASEEYSEYDSSDGDYSSKKNGFKKKVFDNDEGEYIEFEEIKD